MAILFIYISEDEGKTVGWKPVNINKGESPLDPLILVNDNWSFFNFKGQFSDDVYPL